MTNEEKQALIDFLKFLVAGSAGQHRQIYEIALAALTAQPVKLPDISAGKYYTEEGSFKAFDYKRDLKDSIRTAGNEVQE